ncbi:MAG: GAF domain-containing sensor histidine kinase [Armatimonadetes bacterium]|nr:GAF domain-containing sensor histidine kinase [Armatimonadota bacterium]
MSSDSHSHDGSLESLQRELAERNGQLDAVRRITAALSSKTDLDEILRETLTSCLDAVHANAGSILIYEEADRMLHFSYVVGEAAPILTGRTLDPRQGIAGEVYRTGQAKITEDVRQDKSHFEGIDAVTHYHTKNMVTVPLKSIEGDPVGVMQILNKEGGGFFDEHDIDTLMILSAQAASAIENARLYLEAQLAVVVKLMGDISHDVKNMITPVSVCAQTLEMMFESFFEDLDGFAGELDEGHGARLQHVCVVLREFYPEAVKMFLDGADQVQARVREIADCVKGIVAEPAFEPTCVNVVVEAVATPLRLVAERRDIAIDLTGLDRGVPEVMLDQKQMYNCIYNLVNNAIPEVPDGGRVWVTTALVRDERWFDGAEHLLIEVGDTGKGIPADILERLFTKDTKSSKPGGTGLGTRIVKNVVEAHRGEITVASALGKGSVFTIRIPVERDAAQAEAAVERQLDGASGN